MVRYRREMVKNEARPDPGIIIACCLHTLDVALGMKVGDRR